MYARLGRCYVNNATAITDNTLFLNPYDYKNIMLFNSCDKEPINYSVQYDLEGHINYIPENKCKKRSGYHLNETDYSYNPSESVNTENILLNDYENIKNKIENSNISSVLKEKHKEQQQQMQMQMQMQQQQQEQEQEQQQETQQNRRNISIITK